MRLSLGAMLAKIPVILLLTRGLGLGYEALPLSHAITVTGEGVLLAWGFREHVRGRGLIGAHLRLGVAAAVLAAVALALRDHVHVVLVCVAAGGAYVAVAWALGFRELPLGRPKGLPPFLDDATRDALGHLGEGRISVDGDVVANARGAWRLVASEGRLGLAPAGEGRVGDLGGVGIVVRIGRAPSMRGLTIGARTWHAVGDTVVEGPVEGPRIRVP